MALALAYDEAVTEGTDPSSKKAAQMRRLSVSRHQTRRTISLPAINEAGAIVLFHVGLARSCLQLPEWQSGGEEGGRWVVHYICPQGSG